MEIVKKLKDTEIYLFSLFTIAGLLLIYLEFSRVEGANWVVFLMSLVLLFSGLIGIVVCFMEVENGERS